MRRTYYLTTAGRLSRKDNSLYFEPTDEEKAAGASKRHLPVTSAADFYVFSALDVNSALLNFLGQQDIALHYFDWFGNYTGSFMPRPGLLAGQVKLAQAKHILSQKKRMTIAIELVTGAAHNMNRNIRYYSNRGRAELTTVQVKLREGILQLANARTIPELMGMEGQLRLNYYTGFDCILERRLVFESRTKNPPENELNALISFANSLCYAECLRAIHNTQLDPTLSFLHEPGYRRFSLALDLAEIFKPLLADRLIFQLVNRQQMTKDSFEQAHGGLLLKPNARKVFLQAWDERMSTTIQHATLKRKVSYRHLIRLEAYKLIKAVLGVEVYKSFRLNW